MKYIFLDDERIPEDVFWEKYDHGEFTIVRNYDQFVNCVEQLDRDLTNYVFSFDHDLGEEKSGYDCLKWLVKYCFDNNILLPDCMFHTQNPIGKENMKCYYDNAVRVELMEMGNLE